MPNEKEMRPSRQARRRTTVKNHRRLYISDDLFMKATIIGGFIFTAYLTCLFWGVIPCP